MHMTPNTRLALEFWLSTQMLEMKKLFLLINWKVSRMDSRLSGLGKYSGELLEEWKLLINILKV